MDRRIVLPLALIGVLALGIVGAAALTGGGDDEVLVAQDTTTTSSSSSSTSTSTTSIPTAGAPATPSDPTATGANGDEPYVEVPCTDGTMCGELTTEQCQGAMCGEIAPQPCPAGSSDCGDVATQPCQDAAMCGDIRPQPFTGEP